MENLNPPRLARNVLPMLGSAVGAITLAGCQSFEYSPIDLADHRSNFDERLEATESIAKFVNRLGTDGTSAPERFDLSDGLSPAEGEVLALFYNPDIRLARLDAGVALARFETAGLWQDPQFGFDAAELLSPTGPLEYGLTVGLTLPLSGRLGIEKERARAEYNAELLRIVDAEWDLRATVRSAWASWVIAAEHLRLANEAVLQVKRIAEITDRLEAAEELSRVEGRLMRAELVGSQVKAVEAEFNEARARVTLLRLIGLSPDAAVELLLVHPHAELAQTDDAIARIIQSNTTLAVRRAEYHVREESLRLEVRKQYPDLSIGTGYGSEDNDDRLLLGISLPFPILNANRAGIAEARAQRDVARAVAETSLEKLTGDFSIARATYESAMTQLQTFARELVPMLDKQALEVENLVELGEVDTLLLLETVSRRFEAKNQALNLKKAMLEAAIEITRLLGPNEPNTPAPFEPSTAEDSR